MGPLALADLIGLDTVMSVAETLYAGKYYFIDQNSTARTLVTVVGSPPDRAWITNTSTSGAVFSR